MSATFNYDPTYAIILIALPLILVLAYSVRVLMKGRAHFDRVDRQGSGRFLSKSVMEMGYWGMQPFAKLLVFFQVTPDQISWSSILFGFLGGACLVFGHFGFAAALAAISSILDSLDGMVARMTGTSSEAGEVLDSAMDRYVEFFFLAGLVIYYHEIMPLMILTLFALLGSFMVSYSSLFARAEQVKLPPAKWSMRRPERLVYLVTGAALSPVTIPWLERVREFPVAIGHPMVIALGVVAVFANFCAVEQFFHTMKAIRVREAEEKAARKAEQNAGHELEMIEHQAPSRPHR
ncbi:MAG TPA: CDP-alcohol phosphatidyltransferase family protein [Bdellovibrionota bacterium]|nr:CDP-alcohol phosphatidyltransferase family protein [Bdellovibrionota bacterium]